MDCIAEDDLLDLVGADRGLDDDPALEAHLADCPSCSALLATLLAAPRDDEPRGELAGDTLGHYRLDGLIGAGAMGEVYRARDLRLERAVAVKVLARRNADDPERARRLEAEGRAAAGIAHPNVVTVFDTGTERGVPYIVTELVAGESLRSRIDRAPIAHDLALDLGVQLARGLAAAHAHGVVHRDLKPSNLIVTDDGTLKILDFGLAKVGDGRDAEGTEPGTLLGTSGYLAPEQARGEPADARSDLFAAGAILYELASGRRAFAGATFAERLSAVLRDAPPALAGPLGPIIERCLDKDPRRRFQSASDLAWVLESARGGDLPAGKPGRRAMVSRRAFLAGAAATAVGGAVVGRLLAPASRARGFVPDYRQLTFRQGRVANARFTPDGGSVLYSAAWDDLPPAIHTTRPSGGGTRTLELPPAQLLAVSSRGELAVSLGHHFVEGFHERGQLAVAPLEGGTPRRLGIEVQDADYTPDGAELAIVRRVDGGRFRLELPIGRTLLESGWLSRPRVSPDGTLVACLVHDGPDDDRGDLVVVTRTGASRTVAEGWSSIDGIAWSRDGRALWISASQQGGNNAVRELALDGRERAIVPSVGRLRVHDRAPDGQLAVSQVTGRLRMMVKPPGAHAEVDLAVSDVTLVADISTDGRAIVFGEYGDVDAAKNGVFWRSTTDGAAVRLGLGAPLDLADDGRGVLAFLDEDPSSLAVFALAEGAPRRLATPRLARMRRARWAAEQQIVIQGGERGRPARLWRLDRDQSLVPITAEGIAGEFAVRADGRAVALVVEGRLHVVELDGRARIVAGAFADEQVCGWTSDGDVLVRTLAEPIRVRRAGGESTKAVLELAPPRVGLHGVYALVVGNDGDAYAYSYGQELSRLYAMTTRAVG